jgi:hypothetical protein
VSRDEDRGFIAVSSWRDRPGSPTPPRSALGRPSRQVAVALRSAPRLDQEVRAAVGGPALLGVLGAHGALLALAHRENTTGRDALRDEIVPRRLCWMDRGESCASSPPPSSGGSIPWRPNRAALAGQGGDRGAARRRPDFSDREAPALTSRGCGLLPRSSSNAVERSPGTGIRSVLLLKRRARVALARASRRPSSVTVLERPVQLAATSTTGRGRAVTPAASRVSQEQEGITEQREVDRDLNDAWFNWAGWDAWLWCYRSPSCSVSRP